MTNNPLPPPCSCFELRFDSLFQPGCDLAFACDSEGHVDDEHFSSSLRSSYLFARALVGRKYQCPRIAPRASPVEVGGPRAAVTHGCR